MISVSPSLVGSYEYWQSLEAGTDRSDEKRAELIEQVKGIHREKSLPLRLGSAWHKAIDGPPPCDVDLIHDVDNDIKLDWPSVRGAIDNQPPDIIREVAGNLDLPEIDATMRLRADGLRGNEVHEIKSTGKPINAAKVDNFAASLQWRAYLLAFDCDVCWYHVYHLKRVRKTGVFFVADYVPLSMYRYPGMRNDVARRVSIVAEWIRSEGLADYRPVYDSRMP